MAGVEPPTPPPWIPGTGLRRVVWHAVALVIAALVAWLILRGYRQPEFLLDLANMRLC
jgi:hypothetical protein